MQRLLVRPALLLILLAFPAGAIPPPAGDVVTLRGRVVSPEGRPLAGATVWLLPDENAGAEEAAVPAKPAAVSGPGGRFALTGLPAHGRLAVQICRDGYEPAGLWMKAPPRHRVRAVLRPASHIAGRVVDGQGRPVQGVRVEARMQDVIRLDEGAAAPLPCSWPDSADRGETDDRGAFLLGPLAPGVYVVSTRMDGFLDARSGPQYVTAGRSLDGLEIALDPGAVVAGLVLTPEGDPLAGTRVRLLSEGRRPLDATTEEDGGFRITGVEAGDAYVEASDPGDPGAEPARQAVGIEEGEVWMELTLARRERQAIRGRVVGPDGSGIAGALVTAAPEGRDDAPPPTTRSGASGAFVLELPEGTYRLSARRDGHARGEMAEALQVAGSPHDGLEIRLTRGGAVTGRVVGLPPEALARVKVHTRDGDREVTGTVDPRGGYRLEGLAPGSFVVTALAGQRLVEGDVVLSPGDAEVSLDLAFPPTSPVSGRVVGPAGEPVPRAAVELRSSTGMIRQAFTLSDGTFSADLEPGEYGVSVRRDGYFPAAPLPLAVADAPVDGVEIRLERSATLTGEVLGLEPGERVQSIYADGPAYRGGHSTPEGGGGYRIPDVGPGEWRVVAFHGGRRAVGRVTIAPGETEPVLDLALPTGERTLSGRIVGLEDPRVFHLELLRGGLAEPINGYISSEGRFRVRWLEDGPYRLQVVRKGQVLHEQEVEIAGDREIVIDLEPER